MKKHVLLLFLLLFFAISSAFSQTVYITKTGTKYHTESCRYLNKSKITISLQDALNKGYEACKVCKPPLTVISKSMQSKEVTTQKSEAKQTPKQTKPAVTKTKTSSRRCSAITQSGNRCKRMTKSPNGKCWQHGGN